MKKILILTCAAALSACACAGKKSAATTEAASTANPQKQEMIAGGYSNQRPLDEEEKALFKQVTAELDGVKYTPESVSTQVVAGRNYRFICTGETVTAKPKTFKAEVVVFQPLPGRGEVRISKITRL